MTAKETTRLADLCDLIADPVRPGTLPETLYLGLEHLASGRLRPIGGGLSSNVRSTTSAFQPGDVLYGKLRPYLDKAVLAEEAGVCTTELLVLRAKENVAPRFLAAVVHSPRFVNYAIAGTTGVQHPRTSWAHAREFEVPAFTLDEQQRIADLLWLVHEAIGLSEALVEEGQALKRAAMRMLFTRGLRGEARKETGIGLVPASWELVPIGIVFEIEQGLSLKGNLATDDQGTPFLRTSNVYWGRIELQTVSQMRLEGNVPSHKLLRRGDLLVCEGGEIGRAAVWNGEIGKCLFQNHLHRLRSNDTSRTDARFVMAWLEEGFKHRHAYEGAGNRTTIPNLSRARLAGLPIPHPPCDEQREIVAILDAIDRKIDLHIRKRAVLDDLFKALLHKLMTGEIRVADLDLSVLTDAKENMDTNEVYA